MIKTVGPDLTLEEAKALAEESKARIQHEERTSRVKGIRMDRERPRGTGWCGAEGCKHLSHQHYFEATR